MWGFGCILYEMTFLNLHVEVSNTEKILFITEEEQQNIISSNSSAASTSDDLSYLNKIDVNAIKNILKITGKCSDD